MKIDVTAIPGYAEMSAEDKLKALEGYEFVAPEADDSAEIAKYKKLISTRNSELAEMNRKYKATLDENQRAELEREEQAKAIQDELNSLRMEKTISGYEASFLANGYSPELAKSSAAAMANGDTATVFQNLGAFIEERNKAVRAEVLNSQPTLTPGAPPTKDILEQQELAQMRKWAGLA